MNRMPNHTANHVTIQGPKESLDTLYNACFHMEKPAKDPYYRDKLVEAERAGNKKEVSRIADLIHEEEKRPEYLLFDFNRIIPAPAFIRMSGGVGSRDADYYSGRHWYEWCKANWGTKWGAYNLSKITREPEWLDFYFDTAWNPPKPIYETLATWFRELAFRIEYIGEGGEFWGVLIREAMKDDKGKCPWVSWLEEEEYTQIGSERSKRLYRDLAVRLQGRDPEKDENEEEQTDV